MIPVEVHLFLNHVPLIGLVFGLVFFVVGLMRASEQALRAGLRIFLAMGIAALPVVGSGLVSATVLANATWLDADALSSHRLAGILTLVVLMGLGTLCAVALVASTRNGRAASPRVKAAVFVLAVAGLGASAWTGYLGGALRHSELGREQPGSGKGVRMPSPDEETRQLLNHIGRLLADETHCTAVLVEYRLAPEHRFPTAVDDAYAALVWTAINVDRVAGTKVPIILGGDSAGGSLAAVTRCAQGTAMVRGER